jgi:RNA exonuclease NGL2
MNEKSNTEPSSSTTTQPKYSAIQARGPKKKHGLAIVYDNRKLKVVEQGEKVVRFDEEYISKKPTDDQDQEESIDQERKRRGGTRQTKNIGLVVGLEFRDRPGKGVIVGTTHLSVRFLLRGTTQQSSRRYD